MSTYDFGDILAAATSESKGDSSEKVRLNGVFSVKADYVKVGETKNQFPQLSIAWEVTVGPQAGDSAWQNIVFSPKSMGRAGQMLLALGLAPEFLASLSNKNPLATEEEKKATFKAGLEKVAEELLHTEVEMKVGPQPGNATFDQWEVIGGSATGSTVPPVAVPAAPVVAAAPTAPPAVAAPTVAPPSTGFVPSLN